MKKLASISGFLILFLLTGVNAQVPQVLTQAKTPEEAGFSSERLKRLDTHFQEIVDKGIAPNIVTLVAHKGKIVHEKAFGYRNLETKTPLRKDDIFRIASQSKLITTIGLMMLFEEGKFFLDEPISKYISSFKNAKVLVSYDEKDHSKYITRPAKSAITIRQLLSHSAGIPYEHPLQELPEFKVPFFCSIENDQLKDVVDKIAARPLLHDPGAQFTYGLNTDVLGRLIEILSGMPFDEYLHKKVLDPLGMNDTYFYLPADKANRLVELYSKGNTEDKLTLHNNEIYRKFAITGQKSYFSGGAGLVSTIQDYARICQFILNKGEFNGKRLLSRSTIDLMTRNQIGENFVWDRQDKFGLGLQIITPESHYGDNATPGSLTWGGMYCSEYTIDPKEDLILLVFTNVHPYAHYSDIVRKFRILVYQSLQ
ncbi:serine hydrolase [Emticicia sp. BO119]|uniref:serine hydrolase domain-containing protein n=1 Tax=Emticicia sp. BO119 TaxID=2757768 RepID=UPI0015F08B39|nr:serine hydrolase domain-containing protein [Emticicia sp. BO119]MBA4852693.1 beta-lactamase family protein [Emticicia sp. BO119]